jgi:uncharacterized protein (DUF2236 family)
MSNPVDSSVGVATQCPFGHGVASATATHAGDSAVEPFDMHAGDSLTIRASGDIRSYLMTGRVFLMQVAHPAVGSAIWEQSQFRTDPWSRLREIDRSGVQFALSGRAASREEGKRLRYLHRDIQGIDSRGRAYHALDPQVYGWVHTVFLDSIVSLYKLYGTPLTRAEEEQLFIEWRQAGRMFGLKDRDMPATLDDYWAYYAHMIETELEYNDVVAHMLKSPTPPRPPALARMPKWLWKQTWRPLGALSRSLTLATLPPAFRDKIAAHHPWTERDERAHERFRTFVRTTVPRLPENLRVTAVARRAMARATEESL